MYTESPPPMKVESDLNGLVQAAIHDCPIPREVDVITDLYGNLPRMLLDDSQLGKALENCILNAVQSMPDGGTLTIQTFVLAEAGAGGAKPESVAIAISDTGTGIPEEDLERVFEPLFSTKTTGFGLGLALAERFVAAHGGTIEVESEVGKGSRFTVRLPLESGAADDGGEP
jgi:two-component system NtrC family sensor kinase